MPTYHFVQAEKPWFSGRTSGKAGSPGKHPPLFVPSFLEIFWLTDGRALPPAHIRHWEATDFLQLLTLLTSLEVFHGEEEGDGSRPPWPHRGRGTQGDTCGVSPEGPKPTAPSPLYGRGSVTARL